ncbi:MAG TPA: cupin domain-containing protein [Actinomycetota bacterium]|nr:cupin domain-containing protein [Actinomycetota bacterium]
MSHAWIADATTAIEIQPGAVVSKVIHRDDRLDVTVFGFDAGEGLTEHTASRTAIVQVLSGRLRLTVDGEVLDAGAGSWLRMETGAPHALEATEPTIMLLTMVRD